MKMNIITGVVAMALALSTAAAFAQTGPSAQPNQGTAYNPSVKPPPAVYGNESMGSATAQQKPGGQYDQGSAQSLMPSPGQASVAQTGNCGAASQKRNN